MKKRYLFEIGVRDANNKEVDSLQILRSIEAVAGMNLLGVETYQSRGGEFNYGIVVYEDTIVSDAVMTVAKAKLRAEGWHKGDL